MQTLFLAMVPIEAQNLLNLLEVAAFPDMKREAQNKTLNRLKNLAHIKTKSDSKVVTTKEFFNQLRS